VLARYSDPHGRLRELLLRPGCGGSMLLIDRDAATRGDRRLVAHLAADEPLQNAALTCSDYLAPDRNRLCRPLLPDDLWVAPFAAGHDQDIDGQGVDLDYDERQLLDKGGHSCRLLPCSEGIAVPELRWHRLAHSSHNDAQPLSLRQVIASFESYQPMRDITARAIAAHTADAHVIAAHATAARARSRQRPRARLSVSTLRGELERIDASPIVLNRGLREAVQLAVARGDSLSEITIRCGRSKRDSRGNIHGDTSWLARRVGLLPNAGKLEPTPWVHSDVLALIARRGLSISPREVEL
jgi:hypothetical protein